MRHRNQHIQGIVTSYTSGGVGWTSILSIWNRFVSRDSGQNFRFDSLGIMPGLITKTQSHRMPDRQYGLETGSADWRTGSQDRPLMKKAFICSIISVFPANLMIAVKPLPQVTRLKSG